MATSTPTRLGPYEVRNLLGSGAMGEVYRVRDTRLDRDVALKILPPDATADPERRQRFEHEAKALSSLNHPNILTVHDIGVESGVAYIVSELVQGTSLRERLQRGALPMRECLDLAIQIADGLAAAHEAGIVHRDLKPENIMVTREGRVKIVDFGIAKTTPAFETDVTLGNDTSPGVLLGTVAYMSPEQARGDNVRFYADQFAFGAILYEMMTGSQPFKRDTSLATLSAVLTDHVPLLETGPMPLRWLVMRCLHKDPDHRYASSRDLVRELENIRAHLTGTGELPLIEVAPQPRKSFRVFPGVAIALYSLLAICAGFLVAQLWPASRTVDLAAQQFAPLAAESGLEVFPSWSPDGRSIAYSAQIGETFQVMMRRPGAQPVQLTASDNHCMYPQWSPDGVRIYYISPWERKPALWSVSATGGAPEVVLENVVQAAIAPNGKSIAVLRSEPNDPDAFALWTGEIGSTNFKRFDREPFGRRRLMLWSYLRYSPDGERLAAWISQPAGWPELWVIPAPEGTPRQYKVNRGGLALAPEFAWTPDSERIVYSAASGRSLGSHLWMLKPGGQATMLTNGLGGEHSPAISPGGTIAFSSVSLNYDVVRITPDGKTQDLIAGPFLEFAPSETQDGSAMAYATDRSGYPEIWVRSLPSGEERPIVDANAFGDEGAALLADTAFSPDGRRIAYRRMSEKGEAIWVSNISGDAPVRLAQQADGGFQRGPTWSPDGNSIAYFTVRGSKYQLMRVRVGGIDPPALIAEEAGTYPRWSPRGEWIAALGPGEGITLVSPSGAARRVIGTGSWHAHTWSADGRFVHGVRSTLDRRLELVAIEIATGKETANALISPVPAQFAYGVAIGSLPVRGLALQPDGSFVTSLLRPKSDVYSLAERD